METNGGTDNIRAGEKANAKFRAAVVTVSDRAWTGQRPDESGPVLKGCLEEAGYTVTEYTVVPDEPAVLERVLKELSDTQNMDLILTTGGTGMAARDTTPEVTLAVADRIVPGISEAIRAESLKITKNAMLSRGVSVIRGAALIINLPGSPKACRESFNVIMEALPHGLMLLRGEKPDL